MLSTGARGGAFEVSPGRALPGRAGAHPAASDRADRCGARRHLGHAACRRNSKPRRGAGQPGFLLRPLPGGRRVMTGRAGLELDTLTIRIPIRLQRRGGRKLIMTPEGVAAPARKPSRDETLVKALVRAHRWRRRIESGRTKSITDLAEQEGVTVAYVSRLPPLTCLAQFPLRRSWMDSSRTGCGLAEMLGNRPVRGRSRDAPGVCARRTKFRSPVSVRRTARREGLDGERAGQAAAAVRGEVAQAQGRRSSIRLIGCSAIRARTSRR